ncbi:hypothetical protein BD779DRAFT_83169 [Infundibulicybe gibba]|nr:hypothetical protein BD779DRAFT_83169 [Infundibulicybe gibba]
MSLMRPRVKPAPLNIKKRNPASPRPPLKRPAPLALDPIQALLSTTLTALFSPLPSVHVRLLSSARLMPTRSTRSPNIYTSTPISPNAVESPTLGGSAKPTTSVLKSAPSVSAVLEHEPQTNTTDRAPHKVMAPFQWSLRTTEVDRGAHFGPRKPRSKKPHLAPPPRSLYPLAPSFPVAEEGNVSRNGGRKSGPNRGIWKALPPLPLHPPDGITQGPASKRSQPIPRPLPLPLANNILNPARGSSCIPTQMANSPIDLEYYPQTADKLSHEFWQSVSMIGFQEHDHSPYPSSVVETPEDLLFTNRNKGGMLWTTLSRRDRRAEIPAEPRPPKHCRFW